MARRIPATPRRATHSPATPALFMMMTTTLIIILAATSIGNASSSTPTTIWPPRSLSLGEQSWNDATSETLAAARSCLPPELIDLYRQQLLAATTGAIEAEDTFNRCEELLLDHTYQRLSAGFNICTALAHGERICTYFLIDVQTARGTHPEAFPRLTLSAFIRECELVVASLSNATRAEIARDFRHRASPGVVCLRRNTVHVKIDTYML